MSPQSSHRDVRISSPQPKGTSPLFSLTVLFPLHPQASRSVSGSPFTTPTCFLLGSSLCPPPTPVDMCSSLALRTLPLLLHVLNYCPNLSLAATFLKIFSVLFSLLHLSLLLNPLNLDSPTLPGHQKFMCSSHLLVAKCSRYLQILLQGLA